MRGPREDPAPEAPAEPVYHSLALPAVFKRLQAGEKPVILDLGPALEANVRALGRVHPRIYIADLFSPDGGAPRPEAVRAGATGARFWRWLFRDRPAETIDVILAWDLLNHLTLTEISALRDHLEPQLAVGTLLFAIVAQGKEIPQRPIPYAIRNDSILSPQEESTAHIPAPRYKEPALLRALPDFVVDTSYLLRSGFQEYLLVYRPEEDAASMENAEAEETG